MNEIVFIVEMNSSILLSRIRGSFFGALAGDCIGEAFGDNNVQKSDEERKEIRDNVENFTTKGALPWKQLWWFRRFE